jgi:hypothetical protein
MLVSLIIVTYNSVGELPGFFAALAETTYAPYEVLVVDNASRDETLRYLAEHQPQVRVLANRDNLGFGRACNQGARQAQGDLLVFLNPDVRVTPGWLSILARHMEEHTEAAIICPQTVEPRNRGTAEPQNRGTGEGGDKETGRQGDRETRRPKTGDWRQEAMERVRRGDPGNRPGELSLPVAANTRSPGVRETAAVPGCALMIRHVAWQALGGFDERMFLYWEDTELCWRAWLLGWRVLEDLEAQVYHRRGGSAGGRRWDAEQTKNGLYTYLKLMRWRRVLPFAARLAAISVAKLVLYRSPDPLVGWAWNLGNLRATLAQRRAIARLRRADPAALERLIRAHERRQRAQRRAREAR